SSLTHVLTTESTAGVDLDPRQLKTSVFAAVRQLVVARSRSAGPVLIAVEDLYWIDRTSEECLASLIHAIGSAPAFAVTTYRPGSRPPWAGHTHITRLVLTPLSTEDSLGVIRCVLGSAPVPDEAVAKILDRAEGNPLFLEELSRAAIER